MKAIEVYAGSDGALTRSYYAELEKHGPAGIIAMNLFRAQKCSARAKVYRGGIRGQGSYKRMAYERKSWSMQNLARILAEQAGSFNIIYGWKQDHSTVFGQDTSWVLYVDLPGYGQVSFHSPVRGEGPDYAGDFDGAKKSEERILAFCDSVFFQEGAARP
jgi:hypothetical protein